MNEKEIWKWIFETMPQGELLTLGKTCKVKIAGFRQINWKSQFKILKPKLINSLLEPLKIKAIKEITRMEVEENDEYYEILTSTETNLINNISNQQDGRKILRILLSSIEEDKHKLAYTLFENKVQGLPNEEIEGKNEKSEVKTDEKKERIVSKDIKSLETQVKKKEIQIQELQKIASKAENNLKKERDKWEKEKKQYLEQIQNLREKTTNQENQINEDLSKVNSSSKEISKLNQILVEKQDEINRLHAICLTLKSNEQVAVTVEKPKKKIALIGNERSLKNVNCYSHNPEIIEPATIDEIDNNEIWSKFDEIHVISFELTSGRLRKLRNMAPNEVLKEFNTIHNLISYVDAQGV
ncbi:hypothetical protein P4361_20370 [Fictibacillus sp. B-59209]|uniref:hypothetical protein n=1 Tax=Fictibacillus sp. B-59209 TaxID=3024873 RepID=UPI002E247236|nr:hypothetical protein [Fictibacillus sp. B-59209]